MGSLWTTYAFQDEELQGVKLRGLKVGAGCRRLENGKDAGNLFNSRDMPSRMPWPATNGADGDDQNDGSAQCQRSFDKTYYAGTIGGAVFHHARHAALLHGVDPDGVLE